MTVKNARNPEELDRADDAGIDAKNDLRFVLSDARGRRFLWGLLGECGVHRCSFDPNFGRMSFSEGMRNVGLMLQQRMTLADPDAYLMAQAEAMERAEREGARVPTDDNGDQP